MASYVDRSGTTYQAFKSVIINNTATGTGGHRRRDDCYLNRRNRVRPEFGEFRSFGRLHGYGGVQQ